MPYTLCYPSYCDTELTNISVPPKRWVRVRAVGKTAGTVSRGDSDYGIREVILQNVGLTTPVIDERWGIT